MLSAVMVGALSRCRAVKRARFRWVLFVWGCRKFEGVLRDVSVYSSTLGASASAELS